MIFRFSYTPPSAGDLGQIHVFSSRRMQGECPGSANLFAANLRRLPVVIAFLGRPTQTRRMCSGVVGVLSLGVCPGNL